MLAINYLETSSGAVVHHNTNVRGFCARTNEWIEILVPYIPHLINENVHND